jgi:hypothetical protein
MRFALLAALMLRLGCLGAQAQQRPGPPRTPKNLQVLPKDTPMPQLIAKMRLIAASLGVKCAFCHVRGDFASDAKPTKQVARRMLRMVDAINRQNFGGRPEVSCYTCHRGARRPLNTPPLPARGRGR